MKNEFRRHSLRGGFYFFYWTWQYRIHKAPLTIIPQGKIGYVFARDGEPLKPEQTLGRVVPCNNFQDARAFLTGGQNPERRGQRGRLPIPYATYGAAGALLAAARKKLKTIDPWYIPARGISS